VLKVEKSVLEASKKAHENRQEAIKKLNSELNKAEARRKSSIPTLKKLFETLADAETPEQFAQIKAKIAKELQEGDAQIQKWLDKNKALLDDMGLGKLADEYQSATQEKLETMSIDWSRQVKQMQEAFNNADMIVKVTIDPTGEKTEAAKEFLGREKGRKESTSDFLGEAQKGASKTLGDQGQREAELAGTKAITEALTGGLLKAYAETIQMGNALHAQQRETNNLLNIGETRWGQMAEANQESNAGLETYASSLSETSGKLSNYLIGLKNASEQLQAGKELTDNQTTALDGSAAAFDTSTESSEDMSTSLRGVLATIKKVDAALKAQKVSKLNLLDEKAVANAKAVIGSLLTEADRTKTAMEGTNKAIAAAATTNLPAMETATGEVATATGTVEKAWDGVIAKIGAATATAVAAIKQIAAATAAATAAKAAAGSYHGGAQYLASGGLGQDTVPAMLSPGEFVINSDSSKKFFSELSSMNNGGQPVYREQGGSVTNVGDVNVTVNGGDSSQQTVREIGYALRREMRRGTIKL
jgi:predicted nuclease with TOPRIM domain